MKILRKMALPCGLVGGVWGLLAPALVLLPVAVGATPPFPGEQGKTEMMSMVEAGVAGDALPVLSFIALMGLLGLLALVPLLAINYTYHGWLLRELGAKSRWLPGRLRQLGLGEPGLIFFLCVFPAVLEEISFRGLVQHWLQIAVRPVRAIVLASCLFTVLHFSILSAPYIFAVGMVLGWVKWKTGSLYPGILIHFIHNLIVVEFFW